MAFEDTGNYRFNPFELTKVWRHSDYPLVNVGQMRLGRAAVLWSLRITIAAVTSYVVGTLLFPGTQPLLASLTAMSSCRSLRSRSSPVASTGWWLW
jgi:hypothetical protein